MIRFVFFFLFPLLCCAGCMSFDYVGQKFDPRPDSSPVVFFKGRKEIPPDTYRIIGRGILTGSSRIDSFDRTQKMRTVARERGADAVCIVAARMVPVGFYPRPEDEFEEPAAFSNFADRTNAVGEMRETDSFGEKSLLVERKERDRYDFEIKLLLLKKRKDFDEAMKTRKGFL